MEPRDLYGLPLDRFTPERGALAKALRAEGRRDEAASVAKLRKPSVAAWAVNQLVRTQARGVKDLFDAGDALGRAQSDLVAGRGNAGAMREAGERERASVQELTTVARGLLSSEGHELTPTTLDRVSATLHAAAFDEGARAQVRGGCLEKELRHVGLGGFGGLSAPAPEPKPGAKPAESKAGRARKQQVEDPDAAGRRAAQEKAARERAKQRDAARKAVGAARRVAERAARELKSAQGRRDQAAAALRDAEDELASASERAEQATLAHQQAEEAFERL
jgi:hypothetical protein